MCPYRPLSCSFYLFDVGEPESPVGLLEAFVPAVLDDLGEVELGRVPAADPVVCPEVPLALEAERRRPVPLIIAEKTFILFNEIT